VLLALDALGRNLSDKLKFGSTFFAELGYGT